MFKMSGKQGLKKTFVLLGALFFLSMFSPCVSAQYLPNTHQIKTAVDETTSVFFLGDISFNGEFQGISMNSSQQSFTEYFTILNNDFFPSALQSFSSWEDVYGFPVFSNTSSQQVNAYVINTTKLSSIKTLSIEDLSESIEQILTIYENCSVNILDGIAFIGSNKTKYGVIHNASYGIGGLLNLTLSDAFPSTTLGFISDQESIISLQTNGSFIHPFESTVELRRNDHVIKRISNQNEITLIKTQNEMTLTQQSLFHFFPLKTNEQAAAYGNVTITRNDNPEKNFLSLLTQLKVTLSEFESLPLEEINTFQEDIILDVAPLLSRFLNSGMIIVNGIEPITIDDTNSVANTIIAGRGPFFTMQIDQQSSPSLSIQGSPYLVFIDDHLYTNSATSSDNGLSLPLFSIFLWIAAIGSILYYMGPKKYHRLQKPVSEIPMLKNRWLHLLLPILIMFICFLFIDIAFSARFGLSFLSLLSSQTSSTILGIFFLIQLVILAVIFIMYALPAQLFHQMMIKTTIENKYQTLTKNIIILPVFWIGIQLYLIILFNIVLSFLPFSTFNFLG